MAVYLIADVVEARLHVKGDVKKEEPKILAWEDLPASKEQYKALEKMFSLLTQDSDFKVKASYLEISRYNRIVLKVHPLRQFAHIFSDNLLTAQLEKIVNGSSLISRKFLEGYAKGLDRNHKKGRLVPYLNEFVHSLYKSGKISFFKKPLLEDKLTRKANENSETKWEEFIKLLITELSKSR